MILFHGINLFLLLFITNLIWCHAASPTTISSPSLPPTTLSSNEEKLEKLERVVAFTEGITAITEVFNSPLTIGKKLKKLLGASRKCGLVLYKGLSFDGIENSPQVQTLRKNSRELVTTMTKQDWNISSTFRPSIIQPITYLKETFTRVLYRYSPKDINYFKETCNRIDPLMQVRVMAADIFLVDVELDVIASDYSDYVYQRLYKTYQNVIAQALGLYPLCQIFNNGLPDADEQQYFANIIIEALKEIHKQFTFLNIERKKMYWTNNIITKIIQKHIVEHYNSLGNFMVVRGIHKELYQRYNPLGYNYHVGVSNAAQLGHNDTVLQCSTECHYLYNFLGKDIYVIRTLKTKNNYSTCQFLEQFENVDSYTLCPNDKNSTESLEPLAKKIANECKGVAFSLVRDRLHYKGKDGSDECNWNGKCVYERKQGFTTKCHDGIHIVFANYPLN